MVTIHSLHVDKPFTVFTAYLFLNRHILVNSKDSAINLFFAITILTFPAGGIPLTEIRKMTYIVSAIHVVEFYKRNIFGPLLLLWALFLIYAFVKAQRHDPLIPIIATNLTKHYLSLYIQKQHIGIVNPRKRIRNNRVSPWPDKYLHDVLLRDKHLYDVYPIEAEDKDGTTVYSKEFSLGELDQLNWNVVIPLSAG